MKEQLEKIKEEALKQIAASDALEKLNDIRVSYLGKKGQLTSLLKGMKDVSPEERPKVGQMVNDARALIEGRLEEAKTALAQKAREEQLKKEVIDVTLPAKRQEEGHRHPNTIALEEVERIFIGMGYEVMEGPEVEYDEYNFEKLNIPKGHPARDEQDTFYVNDSILLRSQTSPVQIRAMEQGKLPIRMIAPGRVFRSITRDRFTIEQCVFNLTARLRRGPVLFSDMLSDQVTRDEIVSYFMAMLELLKLGRLHARQEHAYDDILILPAGREEEDGKQEDGENASNGADAPAGA